MVGGDGHRGLLFLAPKFRSRREWTTCPICGRGRVGRPTRGAARAGQYGVGAGGVRSAVSDFVRCCPDLENHDPTQGDRQGNDIGPQYRSAVFPLNEDQARITVETLEAYGPKLAAAGFGPITTEVTPLSQTPTGRFWVAEPFHRGYLEANPNGYCPVHATGVTCG